MTDAALYAIARKAHVHFKTPYKSLGCPKLELSLPKIISDTPK